MYYLTNKYEIVTDETVDAIRSAERMRNLFDLFISDDFISYNINDLTRWHKTIYAAIELPDNSHRIVARYIGGNQWQPLQNPNT